MQPAVKLNVGLWPLHNMHIAMFSFSSTVAGCAPKHLRNYLSLPTRIVRNSIASSESVLSSCEAAAYDAAFGVGLLADHYRLQPCHQRLEACAACACFCHQSNGHEPSRVWRRWIPECFTAALWSRSFSRLGSEQTTLQTGESNLVLCRTFTVNYSPWRLLQLWYISRERGSHIEACSPYRNSLRVLGSCYSRKRGEFCCVLRGLQTQRAIRCRFVFCVLTCSPCACPCAHTWATVAGFEYNSASDLPPGRIGMLELQLS